MGMGVALMPGLGLVGTVVVLAVELVHVLVQRAAEGDVELLEAAADGEDRHALVEAGADEGQYGRVAGPVVRGVRPARAAAIAMRLDIGEATRQKEAVEAAGEIRHIHPLSAQGGDDHGQAAGAFDHGQQVFLGDGVDGEAVLNLHAGGNADQRRHAGPRRMEVPAKVARPGRRGKSRPTS